MMIDLKVALCSMDIDSLKTYNVHNTDKVRCIFPLALRSSAHYTQTEYCSNHTLTYNSLFVYFSAWFMVDFRQIRSKVLAAKEKNGKTDDILACMSNKEKGILSNFALLSLS